MSGSMGLAGVRAVVDRCIALSADPAVAARLGLVRELESLVLAAQVAQARVLAGLVVREPGEFTSPVVAELSGVEPVARRAVLPAPDAVTPQEVAGWLEMSVEAARMRLAVAQTLTDLPAVAVAAEGGQLRWWQVRRTVESAWKLPPEIVPALDEAVGRLATEGRARTGFAGSLARIMIAVDPERAERDLADALADREVRVRPDQEVPGMALLTASLTAEGAVTVAACLDRLADTPLARPPAGLPDEGRGVDARRTDAFVGIAGCVLDAFHTLDEAGADQDPGGEAFGAALGAAVSKAWARAQADPTEHLAASTGRTRRGTRRTRRSGEILVTVSAETLLGAREHPGVLTGWGPITATHARRLAEHHDTVWRRIITDAYSGALLDVGRTRYTPTAAITDHVRTRDGGRCSRPGCCHAARDLDHALSWANGGATATTNLHAVCRGCHSAKHLGWTVTMNRDGTTWRTPHGHDTTRPTPDLRPEDRMPRPPPPISRWASDIAHELRRAAYDARQQSPPPPTPPALDVDPPPPSDEAARPRTCCHSPGHGSPMPGASRSERCSNSSHRAQRAEWVGANSDVSSAVGLTVTSPTPEGRVSGFRCGTSRLHTRSAARIIGDR